MKRTVLSALVMILSLLCLASMPAPANAHSQDDADAPDQLEIKIPETATTPTGFTPKGWIVIKIAEGDLNGDEIADAAIVLEKGAGKEIGEVDFSTLPPSDGARILIIALRERDGKLHRSAVSKQAISGHYEGGAKFGDPLNNVTIKKGVLIIDQIAGSNWYSSSTDRYRYQQGKWVTIGTTEGYYFALLEEPLLAERDYNLVTGLVIETLNAKYAEQLDSKKGDMTGFYPADIDPNVGLIMREYYLLRAGEVKIAPVIDGKIFTDEWPGLSVNLRTRKSLVRGQSVWRGPTDLSARLGAVIHDNNLYLRAEVVDDQVTDGDEVQLVSMTGEIIKPAECKKRKERHGYSVEARYPLKELADNTLQNRPGLLLSVEIVDLDNSPKKITKVISTSFGGRGYTARIEPSNSPGLLPLDSRQ